MKKRPTPRAVAEWQARWLAAMRWRRGVEAALAASGITFTQWLVLDAIQKLVDETGDAINQNEIAAKVELDPRSHRAQS